MTVEPEAVMTELNSEGLLPCPFCGSTDIYTEGPCYDEFMCNDCGISQNDQNQDRSGAISAWNRRALPPVDGLDRIVAEEAADFAGTMPAKVAVKRIAWDRENNGTLAGKTITGTYRIVGAFNGGHAVALGSRVLRAADGRTNFASEQDARAAAQSDLEALVASVLDSGAQVETSHALSENDIIRACAEVAARTIAKFRWRK